MSIIFKSGFWKWINAIFFWNVSAMFLYKAASQSIYLLWNEKNNNNNNWPSTHTHTKNENMERKGLEKLKSIWVLS